MAETSEQIHPIASPVAGIFSYDERKIAAAAAKIRHGRLFCCGYITAILLIQAAIVLTLILTIFKLKGPTVRVHKLTIGKLDLANGTNMTLNADVWVQNPNFAYFTYNTLVTTLFYRGAVVGESCGPPGTAKSRGTTRVNVMVDVITDRILLDPDFDLDLVSGLVNISSYTRIGGRMKLFVVIDKKLTVRMSCNMTFNITSRAIQLLLPPDKNKFDLEETLEYRRHFSLKASIWAQNRELSGNLQFSDTPMMIWRCLVLKGLGMRFG